MTLAAYADAIAADTYCLGRTTQGGQSCPSLCNRCTPERGRIDPAANICAELDAALWSMHQGRPDQARMILSELRAALLA